MSAAPIVDELVVARDAEAAADRLLRDQAPVAEDVGRKGREVRALDAVAGQRGARPLRLRLLLSGRVKLSRSGLGPAKV